MLEKKYLDMDIGVGTGSSSHGAGYFGKAEPKMNSHVNQNYVVNLSESDPSFQYLLEHELYI